MHCKYSIKGCCYDSQYTIFAASVFANLLLSKFYVTPISIHAVFFFLHLIILSWPHTQSGEKYELSNAMFPAKVTLCPFVSDLIVSLHSTLCHVFMFRAFGWWFCHLKWPLTVVPKCYLVFLSMRRLWRDEWWKHTCR